MALKFEYECAQPTCSGRGTRVAVYSTRIQPHISAVRHVAPTCETCMTEMRIFGIPTRTHHQDDNFASGPGMPNSVAQNVPQFVPVQNGLLVTAQPNERTEIQRIVREMFMSEQPMQQAKIEQAIKRERSSAALYVGDFVTIKIDGQERRGIVRKDEGAEKPHIEIYD